MTRHGKSLEAGLGARGLHLPFGVSEGSDVDLQVTNTVGGLTSQLWGVTVRPFSLRIVTSQFDTGLTVPLEGDVAHEPAGLKRQCAKFV